MNRFICLFFALCFSLGLLSCRGVQEKAIRTQEKAIRTAEGIQVTQVDVDDVMPLAEPLDAHVWKFRVQAPSGKANYTCMMEVRRKGKAPVSLGGIGFGPNSEITIILEPGGVSFHNSSQLRRVRLVDSSRLRSVYPNPFEGQNTAIGKRAQHQGNGVFVLMSGSKGSISNVHTNNEAQLVCLFTDLAKKQAGN
jgi:hypothetical protein